MLTSIIERLRRSDPPGSSGGYALAPLRVLLPTWRFFDDIAPSPALHARVQSSAGALGPWQRLLPATPAIARPLHALLVDARGNLRLAHHALLERLLSDLDALEPDAAEAAERLVSYALVLDLVRHTLRARPEHVDAHAVQFKLTLPSPTSGAPDEDIVCSALHPL